MKEIFRARKFEPGDSVDALAIGAHPDDVEIGAAGLLALLSRAGKRVAILDLTAGELGSRGDVATRQAESVASAELLELCYRGRLGMPDGAIEDTAENGRLLAKELRRFRPRIVLAPYREDGHPDHRAAGDLVRRAHFLARLRKLDLGPPYHAESTLFYYSIHTPFEPHLVVDIGPTFKRRIEAAAAFGSQFAESLEEIPDYRPVGTPEYLPFIEARCRHYGAMIGVTFGEGFRADRPLAVRQPLTLL